MPKTNAVVMSEQFGVLFDEYVKRRPILQKVFVLWRFEMLEDVHRESGSELSLDEWLTEVATHRRFGERIWHDYNMRTYSDHRIWTLVFNDDGASVLDYSGRGQFVAAFNQLLEDKHMNARLSDNGVSMWFVTLSRWKKPIR